VDEVELKGFPIAAAGGHGTVKFAVSEMTAELPEYSEPVLEDAEFVKGHPVIKNGMLLRPR
jgi:hypothetical protein